MNPPPLRRPLLGVTLAFALGIALESGVRLAPALALAGFALLAIARLRHGFISPTRTGLALTWAMVVAAGFGTAALARWPTRVADTIPLPARVRIEGSVMAYTGWRASGTGSLRVRGRLHNVRVTAIDGAHCAPLRLHRVAFDWFGPDTSLDADLGVGVTPMPGERWAFEGRLRAVPAGFEGERAPRLTTNVRDARRLRGASPGIMQAALALREAVYRRLARGLPQSPDALAVMRGLLLGDRDSLPPRLQRAFIDSGTFHVFAVSGLHIGMLGLVGVALLSACGVCRRYWALWLGPLIVLYVVMVGIRPSALRAALMVIGYLLAPLCNRRPDAGSAWSAAALILLAWDPQNLFAPGFVLSFGVVAGLLIWAPRLLRLIRQLTESPLREVDQRARQMDTNAKHPSDGFAGGGLIERFRQLLAVSLSAWLISTPLSIGFFQRLTWVGIPANLVMAPLAFLALVSAVLSLLGGALLETLGVTFNHALLVIVYAMINVARLAASLPAASIEVRILPPWAAFILFLLMLRLGLSLPKSHPNPIQEDDD